MRYETLDVPVVGGDLRVGIWGSAGPVVLAGHGLTANHLSWLAVGEALGPELRLVAPDFRGRGGSRSLPGPFGLGAHVGDLIAVLDHLQVEKAPLVGHSMGAYVALVAATDQPERVPGIVLVDGGLPLPVPSGPVEEILAAVIGPAMARLAMTFPTRDAYREFWRAHPAFEGADERMWAYVDYDLVGREPALHSGVSAEAVRADAADTVVHVTVTAALERLRCPAVLVRAERGVLNGEPLLHDELVRAWPQVVARPPVPGTNHYTVVFHPDGVRAVAEEVRAAVNALEASTAAAPG